jgi:hypothetical protein
MPSTYSPSLRLELIGAGEQAANWGNTTNYNLGTLLEQAIAGVQSVAVSGASYTLTTGSGVADEARNAVLVLTGTLAASCNVIVPTADKTYTFRNATTGGFSVVVKTAAGSGVTIANGFTQQVYCDATNVVAAGVPFNAATNTITTNVSGNVAAGAGSAAVPSVTFGDSDTGIYGPAANELGFSANGTEVLRLSASALSYISGSNSINLTTDGAIEITRNGGGGFIDIKSAAGEDADVRILETSNGIGFQTGGNGALATRMVINSTGQIQSVGSGAAAAPAFSFSGDADTGFYNETGNSIGVASGGNQIGAFQSNQWFVLGDSAQAASFLYLANTGASASQQRILDVTALNESYVPLATLRSAINTDGSGNIELYATPAGSRASDRRVLRATIPGSGAISLVGPVNVDGKALQIQRGTAQATTSGTVIDFTSIPAGVRRITLLLRGVSISGTDDYLVQIGSGSFLTSGYASAANSSRSTNTPTSSTSTSGFIISSDTNSATRVFTGRVTLCNITGNIWVADGLLMSSDGLRGQISSGEVSLSGDLDRLRLTVTGSNTFDLGQANLLWEF